MNPISAIVTIAILAIAALVIVETTNCTTSPVNEGE